MLCFAFTKSTGSSGGSGARCTSSQLYFCHLLGLILSIVLGHQLYVFNILLTLSVVKRLVVPQGLLPSLFLLSAMRKFHCTTQVVMGVPKVLYKGFTPIFSDLICHLNKLQEGAVSLSSGELAIIKDVYEIHFLFWDICGFWGIQNVALIVDKSSQIGRLR